MKHFIKLIADRYAGLFLLVFVAMVLTNCGGVASVETTPSPAAQFPTPTIAPAMAPPASPVPTSAANATPSSSTDQPGAAQGTVIRIDATQNVHPISPLIYGMNQVPAEVQQAL